MTEPSPTPTPSSDSPGRPAAVTGALCGALTGAGIAGALLVWSDRTLGWFGVGAGLSALAAVGLALPLRAGRGWARVGMLLVAFVGALCGPAVANASAGFALVAAQVALWVAVVVLLLRLDVRDYCAAVGADGGDRGKLTG